MYKICTIGILYRSGRFQEIVNNKKLKSNHKSFKTGQKITISELEDINLNDYWKLNFEEEKTNKDLEIIKDQYNKVKQDIK